MQPPAVVKEVLYSVMFLLLVTDQRMTDLSTIQPFPYICTLNPILD